MQCLHTLAKAADAELAEANLNVALARETVAATRAVVASIEASRNAMCTAAMIMGVHNAPRYQGTLLSLECAFSSAVYVWEYEKANLRMLESFAKAAAEASYSAGMQLINEFRDIVDDISTQHTAAAASASQQSSS